MDKTKEQLEKLRKLKKDSFSKMNLLIQNYYIGIYTVCLPLVGIKLKIKIFLLKVKI